MSLRTAYADARLLSGLLDAAERLALKEGYERPALEHLLAAALAHPDDSARRALGVGAGELLAALRDDDAESLRRAGVESPAVAPGVPAPAPRIYDSAPSLDDAVRRLHRLTRGRATRLLTAHVVIAALEPRTGAVARALQRLGVDRVAALAAAHEVGP